MIVNKSPILITGPHRSGTTWVGRIISSSNSIAYIDEPFNPSHRLGICNIEFDKWFQYICKDNEEVYYNMLYHTINFQYNLLAELLSVSSFKDFLRMSRDYFKTNYFRVSKKRPLIKDPIAFFSTNWLHQNFDMKVICLIRHPAAFVNSILNANWHFPFEDLLKQKLLMKYYLSSFENEIKKFTLQSKSLIEQAVLLWNIFAKTTLIYKKNTDWFFVRHEDISLEPVENFKIIFKYLELDFNNRIQSFIIDSTSSNNPKTTQDVNSIHIDSKKNIKRWKKNLSSKQIEFIKLNTSEYWKFFYTDKDW